MGSMVVWVLLSSISIIIILAGSVLREVPLSYQLFDIISQFLAMLYVMFVVVMKST